MGNMDVPLNVFIPTGRLTITDNVTEGKPFFPAGSVILEDGVKHDTGKLRYDLLPVRALEELVYVYTAGAEKYDDRNWEKGMKWGRVFGAMMRHAWAFWGGELYDRECCNSECREIMPLAAAFDRELPCRICGAAWKRAHHLASVAWCALALIEYTFTRTDMDDRQVL